MESSPTLMQRVMGVITLKAPVYKNIAEDPNALPQARNVVIIVAILAAIFNGAAGVIFNGGLLSDRAGRDRHPLSVDQLVCGRMGAGVCRQELLQGPD